VVTRRSGVLPQLRYVKYDCHVCGFVIGPFFVDAQDSQQNRATPGACPQCQARGPFQVNSEQTVYRNFQRINLQESPGSVPAGRLPRSKTVVLTGDLIDVARPGEEVEVTGVYKNNYDAPLNMASGFPVFSTAIEANFVAKLEDTLEGFRLSQQDENVIRKLGRDDPRIGQRIVRSIAPSIYGHDNVKTALALAMFGGVAKMVDSRHRIRGDINCLLLGDPGVAKSQMLKFVEKTAHRAVYTTGQGASAVGLTAAVRKDTITGEWVLEGGALVLADHGICLIDEFDKMNDKDRTSIHEAMEQQTISISKAGIVTTLQARCAVIAAANPIGGRYDASVPFSRNVELTDPILSRFDVLCVLRDSVQPVLDRRLATFVVASHHRSHELYDGNGGDDAKLGSLAAEAKDLLHEAEADQFGGSFVPDQDIQPMSQEMLRKYMVYAKQIQPKLSGVDANKLKSLYSHLRAESHFGGAVPITVRHVESIIRMAEAHAKMHLRDFVDDADINMAIRITLESFITAQKSSIARSMRSQFAQYIKFARDDHELLLHTLRTLVEEQRRYVQLKGGSAAESSAHGRVEVLADDFLAHAQELHVDDAAVRSFYVGELFLQNNFRHDETQGLIIWSERRSDTPRSQRSRKSAARTPGGRGTPRKSPRSQRTPV
jgi:DNA replication licensing factor MCM2